MITQTEEQQPIAPEGEIIGAIVSLKSGSPLMTVASVSGDLCKCKWFDNIENKFQRQDFEKHSLVVVWHNQRPIDEMPNVLIQAMNELSS